MHPVIAAIPVGGLIQPGNVYVLIREKSHVWHLGHMDQPYVISREEDILRALEMELCMLAADLFELREFVRCVEVLEDCYEFRFRCRSKAEDEVTGYSLYLQRVETFEEKLAWVKEFITT